MTPWQTRKNPAASRAPVLLSVVFLAILAAGILITGFPGTDPGDQPEARAVAALSGQTMGTSYRVLLHNDEITKAELTGLQDSVAGRLHSLDRDVFSTYSESSTLSRLNAAELGTAIAVEQELLEVLLAAREVQRLSDGAFDISVKPLVDLWGFGAEEFSGGIPEQTAIESALALTGMENLLINRDAGTVTRRGNVFLDLSAIAKGYAVDSLAELLEEAGLQNYLVEIGGEIVARGMRPDGAPWRVGIETPRPGSRTAFSDFSAGPQKTAVAASGNYRNFFLHEGKRYAHTIDPKTGWPVDHELASVTVLAESAMLADAWATALLVLGPEQGMKRANELQLAAYFIVTGSTGFSARHSDAFDRYIHAIH